MNGRVKRAIDKIGEAPKNPTPSNARRWIAELKAAEERELCKLRTRESNRGDDANWERFDAARITTSDLYARWVAYAERMIELGLPEDYDDDRDHVFVPVVWERPVPDGISDVVVCGCEVCEVLVPAAADVAVRDVLSAVAS